MSKTPSERAYIRTLFARPKYADAIAQEWSVPARGYRMGDKFYLIRDKHGTIHHVPELTVIVDDFFESIQREWRQGR